VLNASLFSALDYKYENHQDGVSLLHVHRPSYYMYVIKKRHVGFPILTKDNPAKQNWHGSKECVFCHQDETIQHLFFQ
jgi:hypothetical protein